MDTPDVVCREVQTSDELHECFSIREKVFVDEQEVFKGSDRDEYDASAIHLAAFYKGKIIGTVRMYKDQDGIWWGGRLSVMKRFRGKAGRMLVQKAVEVVRSKNAKHFRANIQLENVKFFKALHWEPVGGVFDYYGKPHQMMEAML